MYNLRSFGNRKFPESNWSPSLYLGEGDDVIDGIAPLKARSVAWRRAIESRDGAVTASEPLYGTLGPLIENRKKLRKINSVSHK